MLLQLVSLLTLLYSETYKGHRTIRLRLSDCHFFLQSNYETIEYQTGEIRETIGYRIKATIYQTISYQTHKNLSVAHLWYRVTSKVIDSLSAPSIFHTPQITRCVLTRVRPHFRFGSEIWNWSENFVSLRSEKKAWFHMIHFDAKHQKSEAKTKVK